MLQGEGRVFKMLARRSYPAPFHGQSMTSIFFKAWASVCPKGIQDTLVIEVEPSKLRRYDHRLCVTLHMYDKKGGFAIRLRNLFGLFEDFFVHDASRDLIGIVGIATTSMSYPQIKALSHKGAIYFERRWSDPGNFIYTIWWTIWGMMAKQLSRRPATRIQANWEKTRTTASKVTEVQRMVRNRWTRDPDTAKWMELVGDLMEVSLGVGYIDQPRFWRIIAQVSPIIEEIRSTLLFLDNNGCFSRTGRHRPFFRGPCAPLSRRLAESMYNAMVVHKFEIKESSEEWSGYLQIASNNRLLYCPA